MAETVDTAIVGSGISGLLVARELIHAGEEVTVIERGSLRPDVEALPVAEREERIRSTEHNLESVPRKGGHPWHYAYAFGGSSLLWSGVAPRLLPSDFEMRSRYGIWRDWPISYADLTPFYRQAEIALGLSGRAHPLFPDSDSYPVDPPEPSAVDRLLEPFLEPFGTLALARHAPDTSFDRTHPIGAGEVHESSVTALGIARELLASPGFEVRAATVASRLRVDSDRVTAIESVGADGRRGEVRAKRVVLAAHGIENAALLLRSDLREPAVGRWLGDHTHVRLEIELDRPVEHWASTRDSGISYAWADGAWRSDRAAAVVIPFNPGMPIRDRLADALADGEGGPDLRTRLSERFARTLIVYASLEDAPREDRFVELSPHRDSFGIPRTRVHYPPDSVYVGRGLEKVHADLEERLRPLGARIVGRSRGGLGGHMLGTCFMGPDGVVDENLRHHRIANLFVTGGSAFPTHSPLHPTTTIAALAVRLGQNLAGGAPR